MMNSVSHSLSLRARLTQFDGARELAYIYHNLLDAGEPVSRQVFAGATWQITARQRPVPECVEALDGEVSFHVTEGAAREVAVALEWPVTPWSQDVFVMLPAAAYNGNRYPSRPYRYPPMVHELADIGPDAPVLVTDVPRLSHKIGTPSRLQLLTGDLTTPSICFRDPATGTAAILLTEQGSEFGNHGLTVEESLDRTSAVLRIEAPGVRRGTLYTMVNTNTPSWDRGADWRAGTTITIRFRLYLFAAPTVQALYDRFARVRKDLAGTVALKQTLPFSAAFLLVEEKQQRENWSDDGYYRVGTHEAAATSPYQDWQVGWVGGGIIPFPFLIAGQAESRRRAVRNLEWMFAQAQHPNGLFHALRHGSAVRGDDCAVRGDGFRVPGTETWYMVRKQADALYFLVKAFHVLHAQDGAWHLPGMWKTGTLALANLFVKTFRRYGQLGQYLDCETGEVVVGGSTASAMAPGALAVAGQYFDRHDYVETAEAIAAHLDERDVQAGITTGGPGEILKCADSESAFAMLESFVVLYEVTRNDHWLDRAEAIAAQCLTWCASYDYVFPPGSWLGQLELRAAGSVWANVQNKHSAPAICTLSGDALFKLFRYTGNRLWLEQIRETAHNLPQYVSRADRQVGDPQVMKPGYICERVNFSDWEGQENIGGSLFGSCWPEVSLLLTVAEVPGIYVQPDSGLLCTFDHLDVRLVQSDGKTATLECHNPTAFDAAVRVFAERAADSRTMLGQAAGLRWPVFTVPAGVRRTFTVATGDLSVSTDACNLGRHQE